MLINNANPTKLHQELIEAGITPLLVKNDLVDGEYIASNTWIVFSDDADTTAVQTVIDNHDTTPLSAEPTIKEQLQSQAEAILALMEVLG
jgi:hypothetical protein